MTVHLHAGYGIQITDEISPPSISPSGPGPGIGTVRYGLSGFEVWTGYNWQSVNASATISIPAYLQVTLEWAENKRREEESLKQLSEEYPAIADLLKQKLDVEEKIRMITQLVQ